MKLAKYINKNRQMAARQLLHNLMVDLPKNYLNSTPQNIFSISLLSSPNKRLSFPCFVYRGQLLSVKSIPFIKVSSLRYQPQFNIPRPRYIIYPQLNRRWLLQL